MAITTMDGLVEALGAAKTVEVPFTVFATASTSLWANAQALSTPTLMSQPASRTSGGTVHTQSEQGFFNLGTPTGNRYLASAETCFSSTCTCTVYERVWSCSGFNGNVTSAQTVTNFPAITDASFTGVGISIWLEGYINASGTAVNVTISYTNQAGVAGKSTQAISFPTGFTTGLMVPVPLASGDTGVRSIQSLTLSGSTGNAGNFGITLLYNRLPYLTTSIANASTSKDFASLGMPVVRSSAAFNILCKPLSSGLLPQGFLSMKFVEG